MTSRRHPLDPNCPDNPLAGFYEDPLTANSACGDEIADDLERIHLAGCERCQRFGAENIQVEASRDPYGPLPRLPMEQS
jgi:hypothetical protein